VGSYFGTYRRPQLENWLKRNENKYH